MVEIAPETREIWTNANDTYTPYVFSEYVRAVRKDTSAFTGYKTTLWRWRDDFQNDFAARMEWCVQSYEQANHPPVPVLSGHEGIIVKSGEGFGLDASDSYYPDDDNLSFLWFHYPEAGTSEIPFEIVGAENAHRLYMNAPRVEKEERFHIILKVTEKGSPALSRYRRVIVTVLLKSPGPA